MKWIDSKEKSPPKDGAPFWGWLHNTGIRRMEYMTPEQIAAEESGEPGEYIGCYVECDNHLEEWSPAFWLPDDTIPLPQSASA